MRVLITGASRGIGRASALRLASPGTELALHAHAHPAEAEELRREVERRGAAAFTLTADLGEKRGVERLARELAARWDRVDAVVHNAGSYPRVSFERMTDEELERCIATNLLGPARLTRLLLPQLRAAGSARLVFVSSVLAFTGSTHGAHYAAAKAGLLGLARSLALELAPGIAVNVVAPGSIDTAILAEDSPERRRQREQRIPLGRIGRPEEVGDAIAFLLSPAASYITGAVLHVNGGLFPG